MFYELGYAHAFTKPVILLTQDPPEQAPVDVRQFEVVHYDLSDADHLISRLDNAVHNVFVHEFADLYVKACALLFSFNDSMGSKYESASKTEFQVRVTHSLSTSRLPEPDDVKGLHEFLLPKILKEATDIQLMQKVMQWIERP
ncbi:MAG: hypothetical protein HYV26_24555 [Candidatus Hydrogenedentes bacterium]|nr:hypothetical protein [Candidatus Hydrogenedentota bacterium]